MTDLVRLPDVAMATLRVHQASPLGSTSELPAPGCSRSTASDIILAIGPDEWLVVSGDSDAVALCGRLSQYGGVVVDTSGNRVRYRICGPGAAWALSAGCSLDVEMLEPGAAVSTLLGRAQVILYVETADSFLVLPRRSFAEYLKAWAAAVAH